MERFRKSVEGLLKFLVPVFGFGRVLERDTTSKLAFLQQQQKNKNIIIIIITDTSQLGQKGEIIESSGGPCHLSAVRGKRPVGPCR